MIFSLFHKFLFFALDYNDYLFSYFEFNWIEWLKTIN